MPNWCSNSLDVSGPDRVLQAWINNVERNRGSEIGLFGSFAPMPEDIADWYVAHINEWGTKWDVPISDGHLFIDRYVDGVTLRFDTAWSPPLSWLESMCRDWPSLQFGLAFEEPGMNFMGYAIFKDGEYTLAEDECVDWDYSEDELKQLQFDEAYAEAMNDRRERLMYEASDAYEKAMFE